MKNNKVENVVHESNEHSQSPEVQSVTDESTNLNAQNVLEDDSSDYRSFTIFKPISLREAEQIKSAFDEYNKHRENIIKKNILHEQTTTYYDSDIKKHVKVSTRGLVYSYDYIYWSIKHNRTIIENHEYVDYVLEIEINPIGIFEFENITYDENF